MIETALLGTQSGTQPGASTGPSATRQGGPPDIADTFGSTLVAPSQGGLQSSLAPVSKGTFRKSLEEITGPIVPGQGHSGLPTQPTETLAKSSFVQHSDFLSSLSNARAVIQEPSGSSPSRAGAQKVVQTGIESVLSGDLAKNDQATCQPAPGLQRETTYLTQPKQAAGQAGLVSIGARTVNLSSTLKPVSSHGTKMTVIAASPLIASEAAASAQSTESTEFTAATRLAGRPKGSFPPVPEQPVAVRADGLSPAVIETPQGDSSATPLPIAVSESASTMAPPVSGKEIGTKAIELKSNRLAGKGLAIDSPAPTQPPSPTGIVVTAHQPIVIAGANDRTSESTPVTTTTAQPVHVISAAPINAVQPLPSMPADLGAHAVETSTMPSQDPSSAAQTLAQASAPATFAQVLDTQALNGHAIQRSSPSGAAAVSIVAAATHLPAADLVQTSVPEKSSADKSTQLSDQFQTSDATAPASFSGHSTSLTLVSESTQALTATASHIPPASSLVQSGTTATAVPSSVHPLSAALNDSLTTLTYTSGNDGGGLAQHTTLLSTPNVLEVGVASGSHGWLKVRAELDGAGGVSASVIANSPAAAVTMHKDLPALSAYLSSESVGVSSLVVNQAGASSQTLAGGTSHDSTMNLGAGTGGGGPARDQPQVPQPSGATLAEGTSSEGIESIPSRLDGSLLPSLRAGPGEGFEAGSWLSVRA